MDMDMAKERIEEIRRTKFSIGGEPNPLTEDLNQAVKNLSAELYAKDVHFLMELIQSGSVLVDIPIIDESFYGKKINNYKKELKTIGVMFKYEEACKYIGDHLMSLAASSTLTRGQVLSVLNFIRFLRKHLLSVDKFISSTKEKKWLRTSRGDRSPVGSALYDREWKTACQISDIPLVDTDYYGQEILSFKEELKSLGVLTGFNGSYKLVADNLKLPSRLISLTAEAVFFILECAHHLGSHKIIEALRSAKCFKTNAGCKSPGECFLVDPQWGCILMIFEGFPLIDQDFYGSCILSYRNELKQTEVKVDFEDAVKVFVQCFRQQASAMRKENVLSFLSCYKLQKDTPYEFPQDLMDCIRETKWLRTRLGDYRVPSDCILCGPEWKSIAPITLLPFIDDSDNYHGKVIHEYIRELKSMGVVIDFKDGVDFIAAGLYFPGDPSCITPSNVLALLECFRILLQDRNYSFPDSVWTRISKKWLKTCDGYWPPDQCLLFDSKWGSYLKCADGPFVDEGFYGSNITSYRKELKAIGVVVDVGNGCTLIASQLDFHLEFSSVVRIYNYLRTFNWEPNCEAAKRIWIPNGSEDGEWVSPRECVLRDKDGRECVLRDKDGLFSSQLQVLEKHYEQQLLLFFSSAFHVKRSPSVDDYCELWTVWEGSGNHLLHADCCKFWAYVLKHWNAKTERTLAHSLEKLPVGSDSDEILLSDKQDVFIADDLQLKDLFQRSSPQPIFVWYPERNLPSLPRTKLLEIYRKIGVRTISESVEREEASVVDVAELNEVNLKEILIKKGLVRLILGFLADPVMKMEAERRHEAVRGLLDMTILATNEPLHINYSLSLTSREIVEVKSSRTLRWDREASKLFAVKLDRSCGYKNIIEYATYFSEAILEGLLWENSDYIGALSELIKLGFMVEFNEEAVEFLMKSRNL